MWNGADHVPILFPTVMAQTIQERDAYQAFPRDSLSGPQRGSGACERKHSGFFAITMPSCTRDMSLHRLGPQVVLESVPRGHQRIITLS